MASPPFISLKPKEGKRDDPFQNYVAKLFSFFNFNFLYSFCCVCVLYILTLYKAVGWGFGGVADGFDGIWEGYFLNVVVGRDYA